MAAGHDVTPLVRAIVAGGGTIREVRMFGGIGFMLNGNLVAAVSKRGLLARVGKDRQGEALDRPEARLMEMRGRTMEGYIRVDPQDLSEGTVPALLRLALAFVKTLPRKAATAKSAGMKRKTK